MYLYVSIVLLYKLETLEVQGEDVWQPLHSHSLVGLLIKILEY